MRGYRNRSIERLTSTRRLENREVCAKVQQQVVRFNAMLLKSIAGKRPAWHISTNAGHHFVTFFNGKACLHQGGSNEIIAECEA